ncbi:MAG: carboxypeptidase-like regulatory domain-containing protein [Xanthobacteraceae bacterium]|nr:carboxypeptidase-like regulatory domain-containing protein [Xanthobacteraceae bacterium]
MQIVVRSSGGMALVALCLLATAPLAQVDFDPEGDPIYEYQGPAFFGFVKDTNGASVSDAVVTLAPKGREPLMVRTNSIGGYRANFGKDVDAEDVVIACEKNGFKQARVLRRTARNVSRQIPIEIECILTVETDR